MKNLLKKKIFYLIGVPILAFAILIIVYRHYIFIPDVTVSQLDDLQLNGYDKLMIVAHPDDELIWGGAHLLEGDYLVVCLTNKYNSTRNDEFFSVLEQTGDKGLILSYPDKIMGMKTDWTLWESSIENNLETIIGYKNWDEIVTHNKKGEYGHIHHKATHRLVEEAYTALGVTAPLYNFGKYYRPKELTHTDTSQLDSITDWELEKKDQLSTLYESQSTTIKHMHHMFPYENWTLQSITDSM